MGENNKKRKKVVISTKKYQSRSEVKLSKLTLHKLDWLEWLTIGISILFFFAPSGPYELLLAILLIIPILGLYLNGLHKPSIASLVEIGIDKNGEDEYDVADFIDIAAWAILFRVVIDYDIESFYSLLIPFSVASVLLLGFLFYTHELIEKSNKDRWWIYTSLIFNLLVYSFAGTYGANCVFDYSKPSVYETEVLDKRIKLGKRSHKTYYVTVAPWGHHYDKEDIRVSSYKYNQLSIGKTIKMDLKKGLFGIPWYYIE